MKPFKDKLFSVGVSIAILVIIVNFSYAKAYGTGRKEDTADVEVTVSHHRRVLSPIEEALADEARVEIARSIEKNLIRLFAVISARGDRRPRQEEGDADDEDITSITPNPNVLPQVAQILGAIFSGGLNITRIADRTFGYGLQSVRNQVGGLVKLLTGESMEEGLSTPSSEGGSLNAPVSPSLVPVTSAASVSQTLPPNPVTTMKAAVKVETTTRLEEQVTSQPTTVKIQQQLGSSSTKPKYRVRSRPRATSTTVRTPATPLLEDDEIEKLEEDIKLAARKYEPYAEVQDPKEFLTTFRNIFRDVDFNDADINNAVPTLLKGTTSAFRVLVNLGVIDTTNEVLV